ncbi:MAG: phytanoyl-CoA dioxygenase family protein, partial [candidate division FCPU426 bacterium]
MALTKDQRFAFDVQGYIRLSGLLTARELKRLKGWMAAAEKTDLVALNNDLGGLQVEQLNRPVSRILDADPRFACLLDHPKVAPYLREFLGSDYRHIDNELYYTHPGYKGGGWHRGVKEDADGHVDAKGRFFCPMVKAFYCMSDVGPGQGEFVLVPGSHRSRLPVDFKNRVDLPGQLIFSDIKAGDVILFNEALLHNGRPNITNKIRKTIIINFGRK